MCENIHEKLQAIDRALSRDQAKGYKGEEYDDFSDYQYVPAFYSGNSGMYITVIPAPTPATWKATAKKDSILRRYKSERGMPGRLGCCHRHCYDDFRPRAKETGQVTLQPDSIQRHILDIGIKQCEPVITDRLAQTTDKPCIHDWMQGLVQKKGKSQDRNEATSLLMF